MRARADAGVGAGRAGRRPDRHRQCLRDADARLCRGAVQDRRHAAWPRIRSRAHPHAGIQLAAFAVADAKAWHRRLGEAGFRTRPIAPFQRPVDTETGKETAAFTVARVEPGEMAKAASRCSPITPRTRCGSRVGSRIPTARPGLRASRSLSPMLTKRRRATHASRSDRRRDAAGQSVQLDRGRIDLVTREAFAAALPEIASHRCRSSAPMA